MVDIFATISEYISIMYILSVNLAAYLLITTYNTLAKSGIKPGIRRLIKRLLTVAAGVIMWFVYYHFDLITITTAIPSFLLAIVAYDYLIKTILIKLGILNQAKS